MGTAVSLAQALTLPETLDRATFAGVTGHVFAESAYDCFVDHDGLVSKERLVELAAKTDVYLSHDWGIDNAGRKTHERVRLIDQFLKSRGLFTYFDETQFSAPGVKLFASSKERIAFGIGNTQVVIVFMTERYLDRIGRNDGNDSEEEFMLTLRERGLRNMIPIVLEEKARLTRQNPAYEYFKNKFVLDMIDFEYVPEQSEALLDYILKTLRPLRSGGTYEDDRAMRASTNEGRHYSWLKRQCGYSHPVALNYARKLAAGLGDGAGGRLSDDGVAHPGVSSRVGIGNPAAPTRKHDDHAGGSSPSPAARTKQEHGNRGGTKDSDAQIVVYAGRPGSPAQVGSNPSHNANGSDGGRGSSKLQQQQRQAPGTPSASSNHGPPEVNSLHRLWQRVENSLDFLLQLNIPLVDATLIREALRQDLHNNMDVFRCAAIDAVAEGERKKLERGVKELEDRTLALNDAANALSEIRIMTLEDRVSFQYREDLMLYAMREKFGRLCDLSVKEAQERKMEFSTFLSGLQDTLTQKQSEMDDEYRHQHLRRISNFEAPLQVCDALRMFYGKLSKLLGRNVTGLSYTTRNHGGVNVNKDYGGHMDDSSSMHSSSSSATSTSTSSASSASRSRSKGSGRRRSGSGGGDADDEDKRKRDRIRSMVGSIQEEDDEEEEEAEDEEDDDSEADDSNDEGDNGNALVVHRAGDRGGGEEDNDDEDDDLIELPMQIEPLADLEEFRQKDVRSFPETHRNIEHLLTEAAFIFHKITLMSTRGHKHAGQISTNGALKLSLSILSSIYVFAFRVSDEVSALPGLGTVEAGGESRRDKDGDGKAAGGEAQQPQPQASPSHSAGGDGDDPHSFRRLRMPQACIVALRYMCQYDTIEEGSINPKALMILGRCGAVPLLLEVIRFHIDDADVVEASLDLLSVLCTAAAYENAHLTALLGRSMANLHLLMLLLAKFSSYAKIKALITSILCCFVRNGSYDLLLESMRIHDLAAVMVKTMEVHCVDHESFVIHGGVIKDKDDEQSKKGVAKSRDADQHDDARSASSGTMRSSASARGTTNNTINTLRLNNALHTNLLLTNTHADLNNMEVVHRFCRNITNLTYNRFQYGLNNKITHNFVFPPTLSSSLHSALTQERMMEVLFDVLTVYQKSDLLVLPILSAIGNCVAFNPACKAIALRIINRQFNVLKNTFKAKRNFKKFGFTVKVPLVEVLHRFSINVGQDEEDERRRWEYEERKRKEEEEEARQEEEKLRRRLAAKKKRRYGGGGGKGGDGKDEEEEIREQVRAKMRARRTKRGKGVAEDPDAPPVVNPALAQRNRTVVYQTLITLSNLMFLTEDERKVEAVEGLDEGESREDERKRLHKEELQRAKEAKEEEMMTTMMNSQALDEHSGSVASMRGSSVLGSVDTVGTPARSKSVGKGEQQPEQKQPASSFYFKEQDIANQRCDYYDGVSTTQLLLLTQTFRQLLIRWGVMEMIMHMFVVATERREAHGGEMDGVMLKYVLTFVSRLTFRGEFYTCERLVALGMCKRIVDVVNRLIDSKPHRHLYLIASSALLGLVSSHSSLIGGSTRLVEQGLCELTIRAMRVVCSNSLGSRRWTHLNYPFDCKCCLHSCMIIHRLLLESHTNRTTKETLIKLLFHGLLARPPRLFTMPETLLTDAVVSTSLPQQEFFFNTESKLNEDQSDFDNGSSFEAEDGAAASDPHSATDKQRERRSRMKREDRDAEEKDEAYFAEHHYRKFEQVYAYDREAFVNIEYVPNISRQEKEEIMQLIFREFCIDVSLERREFK